MIDADLILLGQSASHSKDELSTATIRSSQSHIRLLKANNVVLERNTFLQGTNNLLNSLRDSKGNKLSTSYKQQIYFTIRRLFGINDGNYKEFRIKRTPNMLPDSFKDDINKLIKFSLDLFKEILSSKQHVIERIVLFEVAQVILCIIATSLRIEEIRQLKYEHLPIILSQQPIPIKSKRTYNSRLIANSVLLESLINVFNKTRDMKSNSLLPLAMYSKAKTRSSEGYLFYFSTTLIRQKFKEICTLCQVSKDSHLKLNSLRKFTVTMIIDQGGINEAAFLNNHSNVNTTIDNYNLQAENNANSVFNQLLTNQIDEKQFEMDLNQIINEALQ